MNAPEKQLPLSDLAAEVRHGSLSRMSATWFSLSSGIAAVAIATVGCAGSTSHGKVPAAARVSATTAMSSELVDREGVRVLRGSRSSVFAATAGALRVLGYSIAFADHASTVLKTEPMAILTIASVRGSYQGYGAGYEGSAVSSSYARSYNVTFFDAPQGILVRAAPRMFINGQDVSGGLVWQLDGPQGERTHWDRLFREIASNLGNAPADSSGQIHALHMPGLPSRAADGRQTAASVVSKFEAGGDVKLSSGVSRRSARAV